MSFPVDSPRGPSSLRRARKAAARREDSAPAYDSANLPVPVDAPATVAPGPSSPGGAAAIEAQVIGERRGLRAGPTIHDEARGAYNRVEWSGTRDRRAPKGRTTKTQV